MSQKKQTKNKKRLKLRVNVVLKLLLFILVVASLFSYINSLNIKHIKISGTENIKDVAIIEVLNIEDYPKIYKLNIKKMNSILKSIPLVKDSKIKRNIFGDLKIEITEDKILFFYKYNNKFITSAGDSIENSSEYYGYPTLINFTPDTVFDSLVKGFNKIDYNIIRMIDEIEYTPYKASDGTIIDNNHFTLMMNDTNTVMIDTVNIKNLNKYNTIIASSDIDQTHGIIYLDTINDDRIYIKSYETIAKEEQEAASKIDSEQTAE